MDFHSLPRRELQALCKRNRIPANTTNVAMADSLHSLKLEGRLIEVAQETMLGSPENILAGSVRKASARRGAAPSAGASVEPKEPLASPLPRARRVSVKASEMRRLISEGEGEEEEKNEDLVAITTPVPVVKRSTAKKPAARSTRRGASKKENDETAEDGPLEASKTPATRNGRRTAAARKGVETPAIEEQDEHDPLFSPRISTRRTKQTSKSNAVIDNATSTVRRSTRIRARTSVPEIEILILEPEQAEEGVGNKDSSEKTLCPEAGNVCDLKDKEGVEYEITANNCAKDCDLVVADVVVDVVKEDGAPAETTEIDNASEEETVAPKEVEQGFKINIPIERAVAADEEPSDLQEEIGGSDGKDFQEEIGGSDEKLSNLNEEIGGSDGKDFQEEIGGSDEKLSNLNEEIGGSDEKDFQEEIGGSDEKLSNLNEEIGGSDEKDFQEEIGGSDEKLSNLNEEIGGSDEKDFQEEIGGSDEKLSNSNEEIGGSDEKLSNLNEEIGGSDEKDFQEEIGGSDEKLSNSNEEIGGSDEKLSNLNEEIGGSDEKDFQEELGGSDEKLSNLNEEIEGGTDEITHGNDSEQDSVSQHQLDVDSDEAEGFDEQLVAEVEGCSEVDAKGTTQEIEDCEEDSSGGVFENAIVTQHQLSVDAKKGIEDLEEKSNGVLENAVLPQHQLANDCKEDGMVQETVGIDELVAKVEECPEVSKEGMTKETEGCEQEDSHGITENAIFPQQLVESIPVEGLVTSLENLTIASDDADCWPSDKEDDEESLPDSQLVTEELQGSSPVKSHACLAPPDAIESAISSSPEKAAVEDSEIVTEALQISSPVKSQASAAPPEATDSAISSSPEKTAVEEPSDSGDVITSESKSEESSDAVVKNDGPAEFAVAGAAYGEMKAENDAEEEGKEGLDVDYNLMSMRKLKTVYKEKLIEKKVEGRRLPLAEINDNQCG